MGVMNQRAIGMHECQGVDQRHVSGLALRSAHLSHDGRPLARSEGFHDAFLSKQSHLLCVDSAGFDDDRFSKSRLKLVTRGIGSPILRRFSSIIFALSASYSFWGTDMVLRICREGQMAEQQRGR